MTPPEYAVFGALIALIGVVVGVTIGVALGRQLGHHEERARLDRVERWHARQQRRTAGMPDPVATQPVPAFDPHATQVMHVVEPLPRRKPADEATQVMRQIFEDGGR